MDYKELTIKVLTEVFNETSDKLSELIETTDGEIKSDASILLVNKFADKVKSFKEEAKTKFTEGQESGYSRAKKEVMTEFEKDVKKTFDVDSDLTGLELVTEVVNKNSKKQTTKPTSEQVKSSPEYLDLENKFNNLKGIDEKFTALQSEHDQFKSTMEREKVLAVVKQKALSHLDALNPILPQDPVKKSNQKNIFLNFFTDYDYIIEDNEIKGIKKGEQRVEDKVGNALNFNQFVEVKANELFDFNQQGAKGSAGNKEGGNGSATGDDFDMPKTKKEYTELMRELKDDEKRVKVYDWYKENESTLPD